MRKRFVPFDQRWPDQRKAFPFADLPPVQPPVDCSDAAVFPNIAAAIRFARQLGEQDIG